MTVNGVRRDRILYSPVMLRNALRKGCVKNFQHHQRVMSSSLCDSRHFTTKLALNINLDMIGTYMGKFIACVTAEEKLSHYISYMAAEVGFPVASRTGVYSSDSTPFADKGVPAVSFARIAGGNVAPIHCRYDLMDVMSMEQLERDIDFLSLFTERFANAVVCPVSREIPEDIKKQLDEYLFRKRKE